MQSPKVVYLDQVVYVDNELNVFTPEVLLTEAVETLAMVTCSNVYIEPTFNPSIGMWDEGRYVYCFTGEQRLALIFNDEAEAHAFTRAARICFLAYRQSLYEHALYDLITA